MSKHPHLAVVEALPEQQSAVPRQMLKDVMMFRGIYTLNDMTKNNLKITHFTLCLSGGRDPMWGIWTKSGRLIRLVSRRKGVEEVYPNKVWKRLQANWDLRTVYSSEDEVDVKAQLAAFHK